MEAHSANKPKVSQADAPDAEFHGIGPNGYLMLVYRGKKYTGVGTLFVMKQKTGADGRISRFFRQIHETPTELAPLHRQAVSIECVGIHDHKRYRFRGLLRSKKRDAPRLPVPADPTNATKPLSDESFAMSTVASKSSPAEGQGQTPQSVVPALVNDNENNQSTTRKKAIHRPEDTEAAIAELKWVKAMIEAGIDANIKLSTICLLTSKSRATLERELTQGKLPPPRIRGRLRYWSLNDVYAYLTGTGPATPAT